MTRYELRGADEAALPLAAALIRASGVEPHPPLLYRARTGASEPRELPRRGTIAILPKPETPTALSVHRRDGEVFAAGTTITFTVGTDNDPDSDYVQLSVDVSGLPGLDLLTVTPRANRMVVAAVVHIPDPPLAPVAARARTLARRELGVARFDDQQAIDVVVAVDSSPSMRRFLTDGSLETVLQVCAGIASVVDPDRQVEAVLCGRSSRSVGMLGLATAAVELVAAVSTEPLRTGCRYPSEAPGPRQVRFLVTDAAAPATPQSHVIRLGPEPPDETALDQLVPLLVGAVRDVQHALAVADGPAETGGRS